MVDKWETNVGQLRIVGGTRLEDPPNLAIAEQRSLLPTSGRGKGRLYVLIELSGPAFGRDELEQDLADTIAEEYFHTPGTVTYGLRQAVLLANTHLLRANAQISSEHRGGGVACVVVRDGEAFIAQAGWPIVYLAHREQVQVFPDSLLGDEDASVLGQRQAAEVRLFRTPVQAGDSILVADGAMARQLGISHVEDITSGGIDHAIANLETLAPAQDCTAMVIRVGSQRHRAAEAEQWTFTPVEQSSTMEPTLAEEGVAPSAPTAPPPEQTLDPFVDTASVEAFAASRRARQAEPSGTEWLGNAIGTLAAAMRTLGERMLPDRKPSQTTSTHRRAEPAARRTTRQEPKQARQWLIVAIALPVAAVLAALGYRSYRNWSLQQQFNEHLEAAILKREIALNSTESPTVAKEYWMQVLQSLAQASTLQPENEQLPEFRSEAQVAIDQIDGVVRLEQPYQLYNYAVPGSMPSRIIVAGLDVYVMDQGTERVYHHALNELRDGLRDPDADQVLVQQGQSFDGKTVGSLIDIAWIKEGGERQSGALLILDHNGLLLEYDPTWGQLHTQVVGGQEAWRTPIALQTYDANLYLLDTTANQIHKYWAGRYGEASDAWLKQGTVDLLKAVDMAIDGNIYVLHSDGILQKYFGGEMVPFALTQIPRPLIHADTFYFDEEEIVEHIYLVDTLEQRLVQVNRDGVFVRQFQPERGQEALFQDLSGVFVDETGGKLYYVAANTLYATDIPPVAE